MDSDKIHDIEYLKLNEYKIIEDDDGNSQIVQIQPGVFSGDYKLVVVKQTVEIDFTNDFDLFKSLVEQANAEKIDLDVLIFNQINLYSSLQKDTQDLKIKFQQATKELTDTKEENQELKGEINKLSQELNDVKKNQAQDITIPDGKTINQAKESLPTNTETTNNQN